MRRLERLLRPSTRASACFLLTVHCSELKCSFQVYKRPFRTSPAMVGLLRSSLLFYLIFFFFYEQSIALNGRFRQGTSNEGTNPIPLTDSSCQTAHRQPLLDYPNWIDRVERLLSDPELFLIVAARGHESPDLYPPRRGHFPCRMDLMEGGPSDLWQKLCGWWIDAKRKCSFAGLNIIV